MLYAAFENFGWGAYSTDKEGCLLAVNLGDDAYTTGAVYGQLAGGFYGERGIPESWRSKISFYDLIVSYVQQFLSISNIGPGQ